jgi:hypothetical protein
MSDEHKVIHQLPLDPEKGTLEPPLTYNPDVKPALISGDSSPALVGSKEKDGALTTTKEVVVAAKKPAPKPKKKVSKWILFKLWFNTYRYAPLQVCATFTKLFWRQEILHFHLQHQHDRFGSRCIRSLAIRQEIRWCYRRRELQLRHPHAQ